MEMNLTYYYTHKTKFFTAHFRSELRNLQEASVINLIVKSITLFFRDWLSPIPDITKADISIIISLKP